MRVEDHRGFSHLTAARSRNGVDGWEIDTSPTLMPDPANYPEEIWGIEDPRITYIEEINQWAVVYTAYSEGGPLVSIATTRDFHTFERIGAVMPPEDKDAALFPVKFNGRWAMIHRPVSTFSGVSAHTWISFSYDLKHWGDHRILIHARKGGWWDADKIGLSSPPLRTPEGWLIFMGFALLLQEVSIAWVWHCWILKIHQGYCTDLITGYSVTKSGMNDRAM